MMLFALLLVLLISHCSGHCATKTAVFTGPSGQLGTPFTLDLSGIHKDANVMVIGAIDGSSYGVSVEGPADVSLAVTAGSAANVQKIEVASASSPGQAPGVPLAGENGGGDNEDNGAPGGRGSRRGVLACGVAAVAAASLSTPHRSAAASAAAVATFAGMWTGVLGAEKDEGTCYINVTITIPASVMYNALKVTGGAQLKSVTCRPQGGNDLPLVNNGVRAVAFTAEGTCVWEAYYERIAMADLNKVACEGALGQKIKARVSLNKLSLDSAPFAAVDSHPHTSIDYVVNGKTGTLAFLDTTLEDSMLVPTSFLVPPSSPNEADETEYCRAVYQCVAGHCMSSSSLGPEQSLTRCSSYGLTPATAMWPARPADSSQCQSQGWSECALACAPLETPETPATRVLTCPCGSDGQLGDANAVVCSNATQSPIYFEPSDCFADWARNDDGCSRFGCLTTCTYGDAAACATWPACSADTCQQNYENYCTCHSPLSNGDPCNPITGGAASVAHRSVALVVLAATALMAIV